MTALNEKGIPTPLVATMMRAPMSRMDILTDTEIENLVNNSELVRKYNEVIDRESAYELLNKKIEEVNEEEQKQKAAKEEADRAEKVEKTSSNNNAKAPAKRSGQNPLIKMVTSATFIRGVLGILNKIIKK